MQERHLSSRYDDRPRIGRGYSEDVGARSDDPYRGERDWADKAGDEVKSWFGNERAEHRREIDHRRERERRRHEREPYRGVGPQAYHGEDDWLRDQICMRLADDPQLDASGIVVRVIDNEAILDGAVSSERDAQRAYDLAEDVPGIVFVRERLRTDRRRRERRDDYETSRARYTG
jgi:osmotically-inducible protein OsmY